MSDLVPTGDLLKSAIDAAIDVAKDALRPIARDVTGLIIGDYIHAVRERGIDALRRRTEKILRDREVRDPIEAPPAISIPLIEAASLENRDELQEIWARLLANAMDPNRSTRIRLEFIETLKGLNPIDARVLVCLKGARSDLNARDLITGSLYVDHDTAQVSLERLTEYECAAAAGLGASSGCFVTTPYGRLFLEACSE